MGLFVVILLYVMFILMETVPMMRQRRLKEVLLYSLLVAVSLLISILLSLGIELPSPAHPIKRTILAIIGQ